MQSIGNIILHSSFDLRYGFLIEESGKLIFDVFSILHQQYSQQNY